MNKKNPSTRNSAMGSSTRSGAVPRATSPRNQVWASQTQSGTASPATVKISERKEGTDRVGRSAKDVPDKASNRQTTKESSVVKDSLKRSSVVASPASAKAQSPLNIVGGPNGDEASEWTFPVADDLEKLEVDSGELGYKAASDSAAAEMAQSRPFSAKGASNISTPRAGTQKTNDLLSFPNSSDIAQKSIIVEESGWDTPAPSTQEVASAAKPGTGLDTPKKASPAKSTSSPSIEWNSSTKSKSKVKANSAAGRAPSQEKEPEADSQIVSNIGWDIPQVESPMDTASPLGAASWNSPVKGFFEQQRSSQAGRQKSDKPTSLAKPAWSAINSGASAAASPMQNKAISSRVASPAAASARAMPLQASSAQETRPEAERMSVANDSWVAEAVPGQLAISTERISPAFDLVVSPKSGSAENGWQEASKDSMTKRSDPVVVSDVIQSASAQPAQDISVVRGDSVRDEWQGQEEEGDEFDPEDFPVYMAGEELEPGQIMIMNPPPHSFREAYPKTGPDVTDAAVINWMATIA